MLSVVPFGTWDRRRGQLHAKQQQHALMRLVLSPLFSLSPPLFILSQRASRSFCQSSASQLPSIPLPTLLSSSSSNPGTVQTLNTLMVDEPARRACLLCAAEHMIHSRTCYTVYSGCRTMHSGMGRLLVYFVSSRFAPDSTSAMTCSHTVWGIIGWSIPAGKC